jgi:hypothetical protein
MVHKHTTHFLRKHRHLIVRKCKIGSINLSCSGTHAPPSHISTGYHADVSAPPSLSLAPVFHAVSFSQYTLSVSLRYHDFMNSDWGKFYDVWIEEADSPLTLGGESCSWSEFAGSSNIDHRIFRNLPAVAERLWSTDALTKKRDGLTTFRMVVISCHLRRAAGIRVASPAPDYCPPLLSLNTAPLF